MFSVICKEQLRITPKKDHRDKVIVKPRSVCYVVCEYIQICYSCLLFL